MGTYRNGTYVAFDGQGEVNPVNSDLHNFELLKAWQTNDNVRFNFVNSHENSFSLNLYYNWLPSKLREYVNNNTAKVAHTPFTQFKIGGAINYYSVVTPTMPINSMEIY